MKSYTEIGQFRNTVKSVRERHDYIGRDDENKAKFKHTTPYPIIKFRGTVKLHGSNSAIVAWKDSNGNIDHYDFQTKERVIDLNNLAEDDNYDFAKEMLAKNYKRLFDGIEFNESCAIFGEWCGETIQKKVAIAQLPKMFVIFAIRIDDIYHNIDEFPHLISEDERIFNILQFKTFEIEIDFNNPQLIQNQLVELTQQVEDECPVGKYFGIEGRGEGIVWEYINGEEKFVFKVKGEKHQNSKVKTLTTVDVEELKNIQEFIEYAVTENRMLQGIDKMKELNKPIDETSTGDYLRWVYNDVVKEESDTMIANGINPKKIGSHISAKTRVFWFNYLNENSYKF
jgi:hypothetical protein